MESPSYGRITKVGSISILVYSHYIALPSPSHPPPPLPTDGLVMIKYSPYKQFC